MSNTIGRYLERIKSPDGAGSQVSTLPDTTSAVTIEDLCPVSTFHLIIEDFLENVYPIAPLVHLSSFKAQISDGFYHRDSTFLRTCLAICAMTISSLPRKADVYCLDRYQNSKEMVNKAYQLVMASRLATSPDWAENPSSNDLICSLLLGMASHYTQSPRRAWLLINESIHCCRSLGLYRKGGYRGMKDADVEINKRAFWMLYIIQM